MADSKSKDQLIYTDEWYYNINNIARLTIESNVMCVYIKFQMNDGVSAKVSNVAEIEKLLEYFGNEGLKKDYKYYCDKLAGKAL